MNAPPRDDCAFCAQSWLRQGRALCLGLLSASLECREQVRTLSLV